MAFPIRVDCSVTVSPRPDPWPRREVCAVECLKACVQFVLDPIVWGVSLLDDSPGGLPACDQTVQSGKCSKVFSARSTCSSVPLQGLADRGRQGAARTRLQHWEPARGSARVRRRAARLYLERDEGLLDGPETRSASPGVRPATCGKPLQNCALVILQLLRSTISEYSVVVFPLAFSLLSFFTKGDGLRDSKQHKQESTFFQCSFDVFLNRVS